MLPWVIGGIALATLVAVEILVRKNDSVYVAIPRTLVAILLGAVVSYQVQQAFSAKQRAQDAEPQKRQDESIDEVLARDGGTKAIEELKKLRTAQLAAHSDDDTEKWAQNLSARLSKKEENLAGLKETSQKVIERLGLSWDPPLRFFLDQFDDHVAALTRHGASLKVENETHPFAEADPDNFGVQRLFRRINFEGGYTLGVYLYPGIRRTRRCEAEPATLDARHPTRGRQQAVYLRHSDCRRR